MALDWHQIGNGLTSDWLVIEYLHWHQIGIRLTQDWHRIGTELAMDWHWIGNGGEVAGGLGLTSNWQLIGDRLALDWQQTICRSEPRLATNWRLHCSGLTSIFSD